MFYYIRTSRNKFKKAFFVHKIVSKLVWPVRINWSIFSDLKNSASNFKCFSPSLEQFFLRTILETKYQFTFSDYIITIFCRILYFFLSLFLDGKRRTLPNLCFGLILQTQSKCRVKRPRVLCSRPSQVVTMCKLIELWDVTHAVILLDWTFKKWGLDKIKLLMALSYHFKWSHVAQKIFKLHAGVEKCHFGNFSDRAGMAVHC